MTTATLPAPLAAGRPASPCPDHPGAELVPFPGGGARGTCPIDQRSHQMYPPEVTW
jgi:hypothetical protein